MDGLKAVLALLIGVVAAAGGVDDAQAGQAEQPVFHWLTSRPQDLDVGRQIELRLTHHRFSTQPAPSDFEVLSLEARVLVLGVDEGTPHPASLWAWSAPDEDGRIRAFVLGAAGKELRIVEAHSPATLGAELSLLADEVERRRRLAARRLASPIAAAATPNGPAWVLRAEAGAAGPLAGSSAAGLLLLRAVGERHLTERWSLGAGAEAWPALLSSPGGWGFGPHLRIAWAPDEALRLGLGSSLVYHQLDTPPGFRAVDGRWAVRTAIRVEVAQRSKALEWGLALELGFWPVRTELSDGGDAVSSLPRLDGGLLVFIGPRL